MPLLIDTTIFRRVMGHYPTGVCAITSLMGEQPVGMIVGSFTSVSLDPPLVAFFPDRKSTTWPHIRQSGRYCVNVLAADQHEVCQALSTKGGDKFAALDWHLSPTGLPVLNRSVACIECDLHAVHPAGDHDIALGFVRSLSAIQAGNPMLFHQGNYGRFHPDETSSDKARGE